MSIFEKSTMRIVNTIRGFGQQIARASGIILFGALLTGCQVAGPSFVSTSPTYTPPAQPVQPQGIEGSWIGTDGIGISNFKNGQYTVTASDTGNRLAVGTYSYTTQTLAAVTFRSLLRGTTINANCQLMNPQQLNCTTSSGAQLVLRRHAGYTPPTAAASAS